jgi:hypothetical protein
MLEQQPIGINQESIPTLVTLKVPGKWMLISPPQSMKPVRGLVRTEI